MAKGTLLEKFQKKLSHFDDESYEIVKIFARYGHYFCIFFF
jgi:hypothetical protein